jgi:hypothetical protein
MAHLSSTSIPVGYFSLSLPNEVWRGYHSSYHLQIVITMMSPGFQACMSILTVCVLLDMPPKLFPEPLREGWPGIGILKIFKGLPIAIEGQRLFCLLFLKQMMVLRPKTFPDCKALEIALKEDLDENEESALNFVETDGMLGQL